MRTASLPKKESSRSKRTSLVAAELVFCPLLSLFKRGVVVVRLTLTAL